MCAFLPASGLGCISLKGTSSPTSLQNTKQICQSSNKPCLDILHTYKDRLLIQSIAHLDPIILQWHKDEGENCDTKKQKYF